MTERDFAGLRVIVENPAGSTRFWHDREGRVSGQTEMKYDYGFIDGHIGADGDEVDCYLGPDEAAGFVYVVHQLAAPDYAKHDEDKIFLGFDSEADAKAAYLAHRNDGERAYGGMSAIPLEAFKAKLERRTGTGKIRHEAPMANVALFENARGADGKVRAGVWDRVCVPGVDEKDRQSTEFSLETLSQMVDNFVDRGDPIPLDYNHQSNLVAQNGKPAPALAFYGALGLVWGGQLVKLGCAPGISATGNEPGLDLARDGLWCFRSEVTELGDQLLPNFKLLSPTFLSEDTKRDGAPCGYRLVAVAATNTPWQPATQITFEGHHADAAKAGGSEPKRRIPMRLAMLAALLTSKYGIQFDAADGDPEVKKKAMSKMDDEAAAAMGAPQFNYDEAAGRFEEMAKCYEDAHMEEKEGDEPAHVTMRRMAANFRRMAKMAAPEPHKEPDGDEEPSKEMQAFARSLGIDPTGKKTPVLMDAMRAASMPVAKVGELVKAQIAEAMAAERKKNEDEARQKKAVVLMASVPKNYPGDREALKRHAERDPDDALKLITPFLPPGQSPRLFDTLTHQGAPIGEPPGQGVRGAREGRAESATVTKTKSGAVIFSSDAGLADEAQKLFESKDPVIVERINARLTSPGDRANPAFRMFAAQGLAAEMYPDLAEEAERAELALKIR